MWVQSWLNERGWQYNWMNKKIKTFRYKQAREMSWVTTVLIKLANRFLINHIIRKGNN